MLAEVLGDATPITITVGALATLASAVGGYATLRSRVAQLEREIADRDTQIGRLRESIHDLLLWRERVRTRMEDKSGPSATNRASEYSMRGQGRT